MANQLLGLGATAGAVLLFGVFPLPTKSTRAGDGIAFQLSMCLGIWLVGAVAHYVQCVVGSSGSVPGTSVPPGTCPAFVPLASLGGVIWCLSNVLLVPLVNCIGVGYTMSVWGLSEMLIGWLSGRLGLFGLNVQSVTDAVLNDVGAALAVLTLPIISMAQSAVADGTDKLVAGVDSLSGSDSGSVQHKLLQLETGGEEQQKEDAEEAARRHFAENGYDFTSRFTPSQKKLFGFTASILAGLLSGSMFSPAQYAIDANARYFADTKGAAPENAPFPGASTALLDYMFSHFTGILLTSITVFALYCGVTRNKPWVSVSGLFPAFLGGVTWGGACLCWFISNQHLTQVIAFPMVTMGPAIINVLIGCIWFNEVHGRRNYALLGAAAAVYLAGSVLIALSGGSS